jgi:hypothetical protein
MALNFTGRAIAAAFVALLCVAPWAAGAETGEFAAGHLSFQIPAQWVAEGKKAKLSLISPGEDAFIVLTVLQAGDENAQRTQAAQLLSQYLADLTLFDSGEKTVVAGMPALRFKGAGSSDATSVNFTAAVVVPARNAPVLVLAYTTQSNYPAAEPVFETFLGSLKPR